MNLSKSQKDIVEATEKKILVASCAGSGKTTCLVSRLKYLLEHGYAAEEIVAITFTNAAAQEIMERLNQPAGLFIGTIHSLANTYLRGANVDTRDYIEKEEFDKLFELIKENPDCVKKVKYLLLDEGQDSTRQQFEFMFDIINPEEWMIFADWRQSIFRWNGAYPDYILKLLYNPSVTTYELNENYRNCLTILEFAQAIIRTAGYPYEDFSKTKRMEKGEVAVVKYNAEALYSGIQKRGDYKDWFILARTNDQIDMVCRDLEKFGIPYDSFKRTGMSNKELNAKMAENSVKVLTIHTAKGLEAKNVVVIGAKSFNIEETCISYVAATRAKNLLVWVLENKASKKLLTQNWET